ncbi:MAG: signal recognition particle-docking protein FtsY [Actinomycetota bacterium]|nr:signal recognition particle-docking protein FtsY [Acidimicrobiales bacterium]
MTTGIFIVFSVVLVFVFLAALPRINSWWSNRNLVPDQGLVEPSAESPLSEEREIVVSLEELVDQEPELGEIVVSLEELVDQEPQASDDAFEQQVEDSVNKKSFGSRLAKAKSAMSGYVTSIRNSEVNESIWEQLEEALIVADVGVAATSSVLDRLKKTAEDEQITKGPELLEALKVQMKSDLDVDRTLELNCEGIPVWLFVGVNGVGKTTTIGKLGQSLAVQGHSVVMAAGDTFRAAAAEQLETWADRCGAHFVRGQEGADPSSVIFDAIISAEKRDADVVLADTAGRLQNKVNLMEELAKVRRVADRNPGSVAEVFLVIDATTGQNGLTQAREFARAVDVTGVVLTKLDGSAKGGIVFAIEKEMGLPVKLVGLGEGIDDLVPFESEEFVETLFSN